jgi:hypothetical protein
MVAKLKERKGGQEHAKKRNNNKPGNQRVFRLAANRKL